MTQTNIELNEQFIKALDLMESSAKNIFITGKAGTGKSTLLKHFRENTQKKIAVLAPTGTAAVNIKGQTIHSFFRFKPDVTLEAIQTTKKSKKKENIYKNIDAIIIDEISMVRADLLDCIDGFLRLNGRQESEPFGGIQIICIGDLYQLPPVVQSQEKSIFQSHYPTPYFFSAHCFKSLDLELIELDKIYRQSDTKFIELLNNIRNNSITDREIAIINERYDAGFEPSLDDFYIYLTTTNANAQAINAQKLKGIKQKEFTFTGILEGAFAKEQLPTLVALKLKVGAQVMMLNNEPNGKFINGTIGKIIDIDTDHATPKLVILLETGKKVSITPYTWESYKFYLEGSALKSTITGTFTQYPVMLAWAITIHKSQGKTFEKVILDIGNGTFAHGQIYVALSRCTSLEGLVLKKPIAKKHVWMDFNVVKFITDYQYKKYDLLCTLEDKISIIEKAIQHKATIHITYLKAKDEKSKRSITPIAVGEMEYLNKPYIGVKAFCLKRQEYRVFRVDRILEISP
ncbi:ATP-dependent exoDNAse(exonuclease V) alpha subunit - helicase superfamily I member [Cardinium endosymbiont of Sogatella furcifera]|uniref:AAA family ATPase n=1 Tax=Cardinium endosymbiont of Sogatella furcifera TaxID=650378 RepID=UPI000E0DD4F5|nr:AAA family ATPase [Cardinium endosymbiont of Sogatella furcifera]AXI23994.1 ATP-dependent exoDNAse(exonuclease V) alpha subunit - helicase superfamily I member [Cardinium endosymbiont of Sogatella furcifera]